MHFVDAGKQRGSSLLLASPDSLNLSAMFVCVVLHRLQVTHLHSAGSIAPGLCDQLAVEFLSSQLRYHYDCIRVQTEVTTHKAAQQQQFF